MSGLCHLDREPGVTPARPLCPFIQTLDAVAPAIKIDQ
jgi:hypothetical protein